MRHRLQDGEAIKNLTVFWFSVVQFTILAILVMSITTAGSENGYTAFCNETSPDCNWTTFVYRDPALYPFPQCSMRFPKKGNGRPLNLADFGLFSSLAYESLHTIESGLHKYFPTWHIDDRHLTTSARGSTNKAGHRGSKDWTTFYQFTEQDNKTSVFAVRGTQYLIDVLQDIDLWLPAATINFFEKVGPNFAEGMVDTIAAFFNIGRRHKDKKAFGELLRLVRLQMQAYPDRQFYITGHSLGGG
eukprot:CAMPEP_0115676804 /NCGR_PEP_ID=MMETSP0272-20121206/54886_1 /TAXON_ID=71861 /ORGANISM="Scrippsiella trochoidea, Strain CCMP3099" /LENGTH=244 /DNA_ID=CAMNT_0003115877 /DNA_START=111 /DNA_END=841 /DNA_ORIENTATION=-